MKILICAYREWALKASGDLTFPFGTRVTLVRTHREFLDLQLTQRFDLSFFIGWSWLVPDTFLKHNLSICFHPAPLPKYRGGSPIQNQILNRELESKATFFKMTSDVDSGPIVWQESYSLAGDLSIILENLTRLAALGIKQIVKAFPNLMYVTQDESEATWFPRRTPEMSEITTSELSTLSAVDLYNKIRSLQYPYPNAFILCADGTKLYLLSSRIDENI